MDVLEIVRPPLNPGRQTIQYPTKVTIDARALFQILAHALRRRPDQARVIGTLVGVRSDDGNEVEVKTAYVVPIDETEDQVNVDIEYHKEMFQLTRRAYRDSVIVGWYATSSRLDNLSALIHDFFSQEHGTYPYPAVLLTFQTSEAADLDLRTYIAADIGVPGDLNVGNCIFLPVVNSVSYTDVDKSALQLVGHAAEHRDRVADVLPNTTNVDETLDDLLERLNVVHNYVRAVREGKIEADQEIGKALFRSLSLAPAPSSGSIKDMTKTYLRDLYSVVHLTDAIKSQLELSSELTTLV